MGQDIYRRHGIVGLPRGEVARLKPATVLEIGTAKGGTLFLWGQLAGPDAHLISVDRHP
jgi:hypothetical protein